MTTFSPTRQDERSASILDTLASADELMARRRAIVQQVRKLRALYGGAGYAGERVFKIREARAAIAVRARFKLEGVKATEAMVDEQVRNHPDYVSALLRDVARRARWCDLEEELRDLNWRLELRKSDSYLLGQEARLS